MASAKYNCFYCGEFTSEGILGKRDDKSKKEFYCYNCLSKQPKHKENNRCKDCLFKQTSGNCILILRKKDHPNIDLDGCGNHKKCAGCEFRVPFGCKYEFKDKPCLENNEGGS